MRTRSSRWVRRPQRVAAVAGVAVIAAVPGLPGCGAKNDAYSAPCAVVIDGSGSGKRFDAGKRVADLLPRFLRDNRCKRLSYVPLGTDSTGSICSQKELDLDPDLGAGTDKDSIRAGRRAKAVKDAQAVFGCLLPKRAESDVLGALSRAVDQRPRGPGTYHVLVVSDMLQHDRYVDLASADLGTAAKRAALMNGPLRDRNPNLTGMSLEITDRGRTLNDPKQSRDVTAFWRELFARDDSGHPEVEYD
jgi:hypothetical protein